VCRLSKSKAFALLSVLVCFCFRDAQPLDPPQTAADKRTAVVPRHWFESASGLRNFSLKNDTQYPQLSLDAAKARAQLQSVKDRGFAGIQVFGPADGGKSYNGLDARDHFRIEPKYGTMEDFRRLVQIAHSMHLAVIIFDNLGYSAVDAPSFLKACDDERDHRDTPETHWFFWSDSPDSPAPASGNRYFMVRPTWLKRYKPNEVEHWAYSDRAKRYYWTRWPGKDERGNKVDLPQYNWAGQEWQGQAEKIVRYWMDTGIDGMIVDAVNWYVGFTWEIGRRRITDVINSYGDKYSQPEGAGGFHEDPVAWITDGGWTSVQDYGLSLWWEKENRILEMAIEAGDPTPIEQSLRNYHDRVVEAGGTPYLAFITVPGHPEQQRLASAILVSTGHLLTDWSGASEDISADDEIQWLLKTKSSHPALDQMSSRRRLLTSDDHSFYAFVKTSNDKTERILVVTNFSASSQEVNIDLSGLLMQNLTDLRTGVTQETHGSLQITMPPYGYKLFAIR